jgi:hypothetical protein
VEIFVESLRHKKLANGCSVPELVIRIGLSEAVSEIFVDSINKKIGLPLVVKVALTNS